MELSSSATKSFRAWSPLGAISQISRSPNLPLFLPKPIREPSGETEYPTASSRTFRGAPPSTEVIQMLVSWESHWLGSIPDRCALATNPVLSGNQNAHCHPTFRFLNSSGSGTARVSPVSTSLMYTPFVSQYAKYLPLGEISPVRTRFSNELFVSCRNFGSRGDSPERGRTLPNQKPALAISSPAPPPPTITHLGAECFGCNTRFSASRSVRSSSAD